MRNIPYTFVIITGYENKGLRYKLEDYATALGTEADALSYAKRMNPQALLVISKKQLDAQQTFKPFDLGFRRGRFFGILLGIALSFVASALTLFVLFHKF